MRKFHLTRRSPAAEKIKVIVVGGIDLLRSALSESLAGNRHLDVFMHMTDHQLQDTNHPEVPEVILLMPDYALSPVERFITMQKRFPNCKIIMVIKYANRQLIRDLLNEGAAAFLPMHAEPGEFARAIRKVHSAGFYLNKTVNAALLEEANTAARLSASEIKQLEILKGKNPWKWF